MSGVRVASVLIIIALCCTSMGWSQTGKKMDNPKGLRGELLTEISEVQQKIVDLADAMPVETYSWRPMEGVRSVSEVYMHIAGSNYFLPTFIGIKGPAGEGEEMEKKVTEKPKVAEFLKKSFDNIRDAVINTSDEDLEKPTKFFGTSTTYRGVLLKSVEHMHEHLGQAIAYARMNKIVPPWTAAEQAAAKKENKK